MQNKGNSDLTPHPISMRGRVVLDDIGKKAKYIVPKGKDTEKETIGSDSHMRVRRHGAENCTGKMSG